MTDVETETPPAAGAVAEGAASPRETLNRTVAGISGRLDADRIGTGPLAELRRMEPLSGPLPPAFWRILFDAVPSDWQGQSVMHERGWALLVNAMALMAPHPHAVGQRPGAALAETDYAEQRLSRLLRAEGTALEKDRKSVV